MDVSNPSLEIAERTAFLASWNNKYPMASGTGLAGMIVFLNGQMCLERNGRTVGQLRGMELSRFVEPAGIKFLPTKVLVSGDWVECFGDFQGCDLWVENIQLLSPNRMDSGHPSEVKEAVREWQSFLEKIREYFKQRNFIEMQTPTLVSCPGTEPFLDPFQTEFHLGSRSETFFLPTSPEIHLKKCLAKGWDQIYEIRPCFRNGEVSPHHQPEFYMLEWYRAFSSMNDLKTDVREMVEFLNPDFCGLQWITLSVADLFKEYLQFELRPDTKMNELTELARRHQVNVSSAVDFDDVFFYLFVEKIEPYLKNYECLFLHSYPPSQAALARLTADGWGDRFEFYIKGLEIANAFNELNNPEVQRLRSREDLEKKRLHGRKSINLDEDFFTHLDRGMPPSCGIALGLDRLFMAIKDYRDIQDFRLFPIRN